MYQPAAAGDPLAFTNVVATRGATPLNNEKLTFSTTAIPLKRTRVGKRSAAIAAKLPE